jgi:flagellar biosynthetic protein FliR
MQGLMLDTVLASLRYGPVLIVAPPFSQVRVPMPVRACLVVALALMTVERLGPSGTLAGGSPWAALASELLLGLLIAFALMVVFAALAYAGRVIDIQAGYGLAMVIDPATRSQTPLLGSIFTLVGGAVFFAVGGHLALLRLLGQLAQTVPLGQSEVWQSPVALIALLSSALAIGLGLAGGTMLVLLLIDLAVAYLSRALPQMNAMMLGFQVKAGVTLLMLALSAPLLATVLLDLLTHALAIVPLLARP